MHDNALARALRDRGVDCLLQPVYTPIRADGESVATDQVFFGGIHVYMLQQWPWLRHLPKPFWRIIDWPPLIRWATSHASSTDAAKLGDLAVSMLQGSHGRQADEVARLVDWLAKDIQPDAIVFSNLLIAGALPDIRAALPAAKLVVMLQGDDIFLDYLPEESRAKAVGLCSGLIKHVDHLVVNSRFYGEKMGGLLNVPPEKIVVTPLSIDTAPFREPHNEVLADRNEVLADKNEFRLGYLARVAPEKGLHHLVDAFIRLAATPGNDDLSLHVAGWLGEPNRGYLESLQNRIREAGLAERFTYHGSPELAEKIQWLMTLDLLSVPTDYEDPKGLFILEALAAGVPVIQPDHGAFGELIASTGGGRMFRPGDTEALCTAIQHLKDDAETRHSLAAEGKANVHQKHSIEMAAERLQALMFSPKESS
tara:strand:+ start:971106 stop:972377 length:1272 start_codon:yes stop_codon:yes gene_type:complete